MVFLALSLFIGNAIASDQSWKLLKMSHSVTLRYPPMWWPISVSEKRLDILSSKSGAEGIVIQRNQAEIIVNISDLKSGESFDEFVNSNLLNQKLLSDKELDTTGLKGCLNLRMIISQEEEGPGAYVINTGIFCLTKNANVVILVRNWKADKRQRQYQEVALRIARSIFVEKTGHP